MKSAPGEEGWGGGGGEGGGGGGRANVTSSVVCRKSYDRKKNVFFKIHNYWNTEYRIQKVFIFNQHKCLIEKGSDRRTASLYTTLHFYNPRYYIIIICHIDLHKEKETCIMAARGNGRIVL